MLSQSVKKIFRGRNVSTTCHNRTQRMLGKTLQSKIRKTWKKQMGKPGGRRRPGLGAHASAANDEAVVCLAGRVLGVNWAEAAAEHLL